MKALTAWLRAAALALLFTASSPAWAGPVVLVYDDAGASRGSVAHTLKALRSALAVDCEDCAGGADIRAVDAQALLETDWERDAALLVMPGGRDLPYLQKLGAAGAARIRAFVAGGGSYLGLCAGGYFGAAHIAFFADSADAADAADADRAAMAVVGERPLKFFPGRCVGPVWRDFVYNSEAGAHAARVRPEPALAARTGGAFPLYQNGGGAFVDAERMPHTRVLLRYAEGPSEDAAAILCQVGLGRAVLTGVHPEFAAADLPQQTAAEVRKALLAAAPQRCEAWAYLLQQLGLPARCGG